MSPTFVLTTLTLIAFLSQAQSTIPSQGIKTSEQLLSQLGDEDFWISLDNGIPLNTTTPDYSARFADLSKSPVLAALDVQFQISDAIIKAGKTFLRHYHPRSAEVIFVAKGPVLLRFEFEGFGGRVVENLVEEGDFSVVPQGLVHDTICRSTSDCKIVAVFKTADPGLVSLDSV